MPYHMLLDHAGEARLGKLQIGTTRRGIGPSYADKAARLGIRVQDLLDEKILKKKIVAAMEPKRLSACARSRSRPELDLQSMTEDYLTYGHRIEQYIADTARLTWDALDARRQRHLRGRAGHAARHRPRHVSVRDLLEPGRRRSACTGTGVGPEGHRRGLGRRQGLRHARRRRPVPDRARRRARRRDARGRRRVRHDHRAAPRRVGWIDLVALRYAARINSLTHLAITKLDVLSGLGRARVCTRYRGGDEAIFDHYPVPPDRHAQRDGRVRAAARAGTRTSPALPRRARAAAGRARLPRLHLGLRRRAGRADRRRPGPRPGHLDRGGPRERRVPRAPPPSPERAQS